MSAANRTAFVLNYPSHYQVALLNSLARERKAEFKAFYLRQTAPGRQWATIATIEHPHEFVPEWRWSSRFYTNPGLLRRLKSYRPGLLVITQYAAISMQVLMYWWSLRRRPWVFWAEAPHVRWSEAPAVRNEFLRNVGRWLALLPVRSKPRAVWGIGQRAMEAYGAVTTAPCASLPYYFDQSRLQAIERPVRSAPDPLRFLFSGSLIFRKGFDTLIEAVSLLRQRCDRFTITVAGAGPAVTLLESRPVSERRHYKLAGFKQLSEMPAVYAQADALVFPSRYDGWGLAVAEAMAAGLPVVATRQSACADEMIKHGENGLLFEAEDAVSCAHLMERLVENRDFAFALGHRARETARALEADVGARQLSDLLKSIEAKDSGKK